MLPDTYARFDPEDSYVRTNKNDSQFFSCSSKYNVTLKCDDPSVFQTQPIVTHTYRPMTKADDFSFSAQISINPSLLSLSKNYLRINCTDVDSGETLHVWEYGRYGMKELKILPKTQYI